VRFLDADAVAALGPVAAVLASANACRRFARVRLRVLAASLAGRVPPRRVSAVRAGQMLTDYAGLRIVRHPMQPLQARVFELRHNLTAYDGMYVTLAEALGLPLLTDDGKFATAPGHHAEIHHYPD
jgi:predicted nucleic acid-binding protein